MSTLSYCCSISDVAMLLSVMASDERHVLDAIFVTTQVFPMLDVERPSLLADSASLVEPVSSFYDEIGLAFTITNM